MSIPCMHFPLHKGAPSSSSKGSPKARYSCIAASNQNRRTLLAEKKKKEEGKNKKEEKKEDDRGVEEPKNNQAAQAIEQAGKKFGGGINQGQAGEAHLHLIVADCETSYIPDEGGPSWR
jgi:G:T/U-mismatch repair DNA glycosylase